MVGRRKSKGVLRLEQSYGAARLEAACARALRFGTVRYRAVKAILAKGLDALPPPVSAAPTSSTDLQGGRFCRDPQTLFH